MSLLDAIKQPLEVGAPDGIPDAEDMAAINSYASSPLLPEQVYVYPCVMANRAMSGYGLNMGDSSLVNFARGADDGTPLHIMHDRLYRNVGYTYAGHYDDRTGEARAAVFIVRGRTIKDAAGFGQREQNTSQEIADIQAGLRRAVSVGIGGAFVGYVCHLCGKDVFSSWYEEDGCPHIPGMKYDGKFATARLDNGTLVELSNVDSGAIPGAEIGRPYAGGKRMEAAPYETSQEFIPPVGTVGYSAPAYGSPFLPKVVNQFRRGTVGRNDLSQWLDFRGLTDETKTIFALPGVTPPGGNLAALKGNGTMNWKELLKKAGFAAAAALLPDGDITAEQVVACFGNMVKTEAEKHLATNPILSTLSAAGVETPAQFMEMVRLSEAGRVFTEQTAAALKGNCIRAFGAEKGTARYEAVKHLPITDQAEISAQFATLANDMFGIGKGADGGGTAVSARSAAGLNFAAPPPTATPGGWGDPEIAAEAKEIANRTRSRRATAAAK